MKKMLIVLMTLFPMLSHAAHVPCIGAYVGRIDVSATEGLKGVVFILSPASSSGSYWVSFTGWSADAKKSALSLLTTAKIAQHRVDVFTQASDSCRIGYPGQVLTNVMLSNNS